MTARSANPLGVTGISFLCVLLGTPPAPAAEPDAEVRQLKERVGKLEAEVQSLREQLAELRAALPGNREPGEAPVLRVIPGDWGDAGPDDIRAICLSAMR